jgi:hypothetical protein
MTTSGEIERPKYLIQKFDCLIYEFTVCTFLDNVMLYCIMKIASRPVMEWDKFMDLDESDIVAWQKELGWEKPKTLGTQNMMSIISNLIDGDRLQRKQIPARCCMLFLFKKLSGILLRLVFV